MTDTFHYEGFGSPNGTIVPDDVFDVLMPQLTDPELRVLLYIIRRTFGFKRNEDNISLKQMVEGIRTRDGRVLDRGTGISKASVARGLKGLTEKGIIAVKHNSSAARGNEPTTYALRFKELQAPHEDVATQTLLPTPLSQIETPPLSQIETRGVSQFETGLNRVAETPPCLTSETPPCVTGEAPLVSPVRHTTNSRQQTEEQETEILFSNFRKEHSVDNFVDKMVDNAISLTTHNNSPRDDSVIPPNASQNESASAAFPETVITTLDADTQRRQLMQFVQDFGREFNDAASLRSSTSRMANLYHRTGLPMEQFIAHLYAARTITQERTSAIRTTAGDSDASWRKNKMSYFFAVLEKRLGLSLSATNESAGEDATRYPGANTHSSSSRQASYVRRSE